VFLAKCHMGRPECTHPALSIIKLWSRPHTSFGLTA